ncbi:MAG: hypothetical protein WCP69_15575 [Bacteroidota bacterium]
MKRISVIMALTMFLGVVIFNSCKKEEVAKETENKYVVNINTSKGNSGIDRLYDEQYVNNLINVSGIDPEVLAKSPLLIDYYQTSEQINECFRTKFLALLENQDTKAEYFMDLLQQATNLINNGDTLGGLNKINQVYKEIGCASPNGFDFRGQIFFIPTNIEETKAAKISYNKLIDAYPTLENIDEQYKNDILTLAFLYNINSKSQYTGGGSGTDCGGRYRVAIVSAAVSGIGCSLIADTLVLPWLIAAGQIACLSITAATCYYAYQDYRNCMGS